MLLEASVLFLHRSSGGEGIGQGQRLGGVLGRRGIGLLPFFAGFFHHVFLLWGSQSSLVMFVAIGSIVGLKSLVRLC
jgi:hypothetical protein